MESFEALVPRICEVYDRLASVLAAIWGKDDIDYRHCEQFVLDFVKKQKEREERSAVVAGTEAVRKDTDVEKSKEGKAKEEEKEKEKVKANDEKATKEEKATSKTEKASASTSASASASSSSPSPSATSVRLCGLCGMTASHRCSRCKAMYYCSEAHQRSHWKSHKPNCNPSTAN